MYNVEKRHIVSATDMLLYNIFELLQKMNQKPDEEAKEDKEVEEDKEVKENKEIKEDKKIECKYCGEAHKNKGELLACARKHKKGGVVK